MRVIVPALRPIGLCPTPRWKPRFGASLYRIAVRSFGCEEKAPAHTPVMLKEVLGFFEGVDLQLFLDCTLGAAGHTSAVVESHPVRRKKQGNIREVEGRQEVKTVIGVDADASALRLAREKLLPILQKRPSLSAHYVHGNFRDLAALISEQLPELSSCLNEGIDGILMDLGMSSLQVDDAQRGFSFLREGPLDMRMNVQAHTDAAQIVNTWSEYELGQLFRDYGEDRLWKQTAHRICVARESEAINTTQQLVEIIGRPRRTRRTAKKPRHPATKIFQALRIAVNDEIDALDSTLPLLLSSLRPHGRLCIISFHSLEDRTVKRAFLRAAGKLNSVSTEDSLNNIDMTDHQAAAPMMGRILTKKPRVPEIQETDLNPRSRSARLRVFQKLSPSAIK